ncbi:thioesterase II family protein [Pseudoalteromonas arctica]|uniref:Thioesterase n=1 Tax=Pseudoalteromonas arctica TaxID=394751 RepID=A0A7Y0DW27_9GAMM|nr:thioesterase [Pseudoalteromonas arctica]NMM42642.1 thioesterase [Pseudoalteromonas arctica]
MIDLKTMDMNDSAISKINQHRWLQYFHTPPNENIRLVCIPYAGGNVSTFKDWQKHLGEKVSVCGVKLAGRDERKQEPYAISIHKVAQELCDTLKTLNQPIAIFGHSMGALIAYETCRRLFESGKKVEHLFLSARAAPSFKQKRKWSKVSDKDLLNHIKLLGGTDSRLLHDNDAMRFLLPTIRSDYAMLENYRPSSLLELNPTATTLLASDQDSFATIEQITAWEGYFKDKPNLEVFSGDHFFINSLTPQLIKTIQKSLFGE